VNAILRFVVIAYALSIALSLASGSPAGTKAALLALFAVGALLVLRLPRSSRAPVASRV